MIEHNLYMIHDDNKMASFRLVAMKLKYFSETFKCSFVSTKFLTKIDSLTVVSRSTPEFVM